MFFFFSRVVNLSNSSDSPTYTWGRRHRRMQKRPTGDSVSVFGMVWIRSPHQAQV